MTQKFIKFKYCLLAMLLRLRFILTNDDPTCDFFAQQYLSGGSCESQCPSTPDVKAPIIFYTQLNHIDLLTWSPYNGDNTNTEGPIYDIVYNIPEGIITHFLIETHSNPQRPDHIQVYDLTPNLGTFTDYNDSFIFSPQFLLGEYFFTSYDQYSCGQDFQSDCSYEQVGFLKVSIPDAQIFSITIPIKAIILVMTASASNAQNGIFYYYGTKVFGYPPQILGICASSSIDCMEMAPHCAICLELWVPNACLICSIFDGVQYYQYNGVCSVECGGSTYAKLTSVGGWCDSCSDLCIQCSGPNIQQCQQCASTAFYLAGINCLSNCPDGYYSGIMLQNDIIINACLPCYQYGCLTCTQQACILCDSSLSMVLIEGQCNIQCATGYAIDYPGEANPTCVPCNDQLNCLTCEMFSSLLEYTRNLMIVGSYQSLVDSLGLTIIDQQCIECKNGYNLYSRNIEEFSINVCVKDIKQMASSSCLNIPRQFYNESSRQCAQCNTNGCLICRSTKEVKKILSQAYSQNMLDAYQQMDICLACDGANGWFMSGDNIVSGLSFDVLPIKCVQECDSSSFSYNQVETSKGFCCPYDDSTSCNRSEMIDLIQLIENYTFPIQYFADKCQQGQQRNIIYAISEIPQLEMWIVNGISSYAVSKADCEACQSGTYSDTGVGDCQICDIGWYLNPSTNAPTSNDCTQCDSGYYNVDTIVCVACPTGFFSEAGSGSCPFVKLNCTSQQIQYTANETCYTCSDRMFVNISKNQCNDCNSACYSCTGAASNQCTSCQSLRIFMVGLKICCDPNCRKCAQTDTCITCLDQTNALNSLTQCVVQCDYNYYNITLSAIQLTNINMYNTLYNRGMSDQSQLYCLLCHKSCYSCNGPLASNCTSCINDQSTSFYQNQCIQNGVCPAGTYKSLQTIEQQIQQQQYQCMTCSEQCNTCQNNPYQCIDCIENYAFLNGTCVNDCGTGAFKNNETKYCNECEPPCQDCYGQLPTQCLSCRNYQFLQIDIPTNHTSCVTQCTDTINYYQDYSQFMCKPCELVCPSCTNQTNCLLSCPIYYFKSNSQVVSFVTNTSQYLCLICYSLCENCYGSLKNQCISCKDSSKLLNIGECIDTCSPDFTYNNLTSKCEFITTYSIGIARNPFLFYLQFNNLQKLFTLDPSFKTFLQNSSQALLNSSFQYVTAMVSEMKSGTDYKVDFVESQSNRNQINVVVQYLINITTPNHTIRIDFQPGDTLLHQNVIIASQNGSSSDGTNILLQTYFQCPEGHYNPSNSTDCTKLTTKVLVFGVTTPDPLILYIRLSQYIPSLMQLVLQYLVLSISGYPQQAYQYTVEPKSQTQIQPTSLTTSLLRTLQQSQQSTVSSIASADPTLKVTMNFSLPVTGSPLLTGKFDIPPNLKINNDYSLDLSSLNIRLIDYYPLSQSVQDQIATSKQVSQKSMTSTKNAAVVAVVAAMSAAQIGQAAGSVTSVAQAAQGYSLQGAANAASRSLMVLEMGQFIKFININYPPNVVQMFDKTYDYMANLIVKSQIYEDFEDAAELPDTLQLYGVSPYFINNFGDSMTQIVILLGFGWVVFATQKLLNKYNPYKVIQMRYYETVFDKLNYVFVWGLPISFFLMNYVSYVFYVFTCFVYPTTHYERGKLNMLFTVFSFFVLLLTTYLIVKVIYEHQVNSIKLKAIAPLGLQQQNQQEQNKSRKIKVEMSPHHSPNQRINVEKIQNCTMIELQEEMEQHEANQQKDLIKNSDTSISKEKNDVQSNMQNQLIFQYQIKLKTQKVNLQNEQNVNNVSIKIDCKMFKNSIAHNEENASASVYSQMKQSIVRFFKPDLSRNNMEQYLQRFESLYKDMKQKHVYQRYFLFVDMMRYFLQVLLILIFGNYPLFQIIFFVIINSGFIVSVLFMRPFENRADLALTIINEVLLLIEMIGCMIIAFYDHYDYQNTDLRMRIGWLIVYANMVLTLWVLLLMIFGFLASIYKLAKSGCALCYKKCFKRKDMQIIVSESNLIQKQSVPHNKEQHCTLKSEHNQELQVLKPEIMQKGNAGQDRNYKADQKIKIFVNHDANLQNIDKQQHDHE